MSSPFEELEYLADYLPEEGEAVLVSRMGGELLCESYDYERDSLADPELYGRLIEATEQLNARGTLPVWVATLTLFWSSVGMHRLTGLGWSAWYWDLGLAIGIAAVCAGWIRFRQATSFRRDVQPMLIAQLRRREISRHALLGAIRHRPELRTLLERMTQADWTVRPTEQ